MTTSNVEYPHFVDQALCIVSINSPITGDFNPHVAVFAQSLSDIEFESYKNKSSWGKVGLDLSYPLQTNTCKL